MRNSWPSGDGRVGDHSCRATFALSQVGNCGFTADSTGETVGLDRLSTKDAHRRCNESDAERARSEVLDEVASRHSIECQLCKPQAEDERVYGNNAAQLRGKELINDADSSCLYPYSSVFLQPSEIKDVPATTCKCYKRLSCDMDSQLSQVSLRDRFPTIKRRMANVVGSLP